MKVISYLAVGLMLTSALAFLGAVATENGVLSDTMGTWVQGIGTIAAFAAAVWAGRVPIRMEAARRRAVAADFIVGLADATEYVDQKTLEIRAPLTADDGPETVRAALAFDHGYAQGISRLLDLPLSQWPSHELYERTRQFMDEIGRLVRSVSENAAALKSPSPPPHMAEAAWRKVKKARENYILARDRLVEVLARVS